MRERTVKANVSERTREKRGRTERGEGRARTQGEDEPEGRLAVEDFEIHLTPTNDNEKMGQVQRSPFRFQ